MSRHQPTVPQTRMAYPDAEDEDDDEDGIPNRQDRDDDGEGVDDSIGETDGDAQTRMVHPTIRTIIIRKSHPPSRM